MPLKLLVGFLLIALIMPVVVDSLSAYQRNMAIGELEKATRSIKSAAQSCYLSGPGNVRVLDVGPRVPGNASVQVGGPLDAMDPPDIVAWLDGVVVVREHLLEPRVPIVTDFGGPIVLEPDHQRLRFECVVDGGVAFVLAGVVPR